MSSSVKTSLVKHVAQLANIPINPTEEVSLESSFTQTLKVIDKLTQIDIKKVEPTHQVTGLENVTREDIVDETRMFNQAQALKNTVTKPHQGYFVVPRVLEEKDA